MVQVVTAHKFLVLLHGVSPLEKVLVFRVVPGYGIQLKIVAIGLLCIVVIDVDLQKPIGISRFENNVTKNGYGNYFSWFMVLKDFA